MFGKRKASATGGQAFKLGVVEREERIDDDRVQVVTLPDRVSFFIIKALGRASIY